MRRLYKLTLIYILLIFSVSCAKGNDMSVLERKPLFYLIIESSNVKSFVGINDVDVYEVDSLGGSSKVDVPVNHYINPRGNELKIELYPPESGDVYPENAHLSVSLRVKSDKNPDEDYSVASVIFDGSESDLGGLNGNETVKLDPSEGFAESKDGSVIVYPADIVISEGGGAGPAISRKVDVKNNLPGWEYLTSDDLPDYYTIPDDEYYPELENLYEVYDKIQTALLAGKVDPVIDMLDERNTETDKAFYLIKGETEKGIRDSLESSLKNDNLELVPLKKEYVKIRPESNGKLVELIREDGTAAIGFNFSNGEGSVDYRFILRRENGEWIIAR